MDLRGITCTPEGCWQLEMIYVVTHERDPVKKLAQVFF